MSTQILAAYGERIARLEAENARLRELLQDWLDGCLNEDCTLCHRGRALLARRSANTE